VSTGLRREAAKVAVTEDKKLRSSEKRLKGSRRYSKAGMPALVFIAGLVLLGPLVGVPVPPVLLFLAATTLFIIPGLVLARVFLRDALSGAARLPVAFALSTGTFGFPGVVALLLHWSIESYLFVCGGVLVLSLGLLAVLAAFARPSSKPPDVSPEDTSSRPLWLPFLLFGSLLALASVLVEHSPGTDTWAYLAGVADFSERDGLALYNFFSGTENVGFNRMFLSGWLLEQAALSKVTGIADVELVLDYLAPALVGLALLAFYSLGLTLFEDRSAALIAGVLYALFLLVHLSSDQSTMGGEFVARITEDKFISRFVHLPVALSTAVLFVRERRWRYLGLFAFVFWATGVVHPLLMAIAAVCLAGFGLLHLALNFKRRGAWMKVGALVAVPSLTILPPTLYLIATGNALLNKFEAEASLAAPRIEAAQALGRLMVLGDGSYIMDPTLLLDPVVATSYLLGVPFLLWQIRKLAAQLLLGMMLLVPALIYVPVVATFVSRFVGPWLLWRLAWPIPLASVLVLGWISWFAVKLVSERLQGMDRASRLIPVLPSALVLALAAGATAPALEGFSAAGESGEIGQEDDTCRDPAFSFLGKVIDGQNVVLVDASVGGCVVANAAEATIIAYRTTEGDAGQAPAVPLVTALNEFFESSVLNEGNVQAVRLSGAKYVLLPVGSALNEQLKYSPGFKELDTPSRRYKLYEVDQAGLEAMPVYKANGFLKEKQLDVAVASYSSVLATAGTEEAYLAYVGLGQAYAEQGLHAEAAAAYEQAIALEPEEARPYELLALSYSAAGNLRQAADTYKEAIALSPEDVELRQRFGALAQRIDQEEALEQYRTIVEMYPRVPEYRAGLGSALLEAGRKEEGVEQLQRAIALDPFSARVRGLVGDAYADADLLTEAAEQYERARELYSNNQAHALRLGEVYARLSAQEGGEGYAEKAENALRDAEKLAGPGQEKQRARALVALGDLYADQGRMEEAIASYKEAREIYPDLRSAQNRLDKLEEI
jgi:tetratricopeptide (TPR) repeat protein